MATLFGIYLKSGLVTFNVGCYGSLGPIKNSSILFNNSNIHRRKSSLVLTVSIDTIFRQILSVETVPSM